MADIFKDGIFKCVSINEKSPGPNLQLINIVLGNNP